MIRPINIVVFLLIFLGFICLIPKEKRNEMNISFAQISSKQKRQRIGEGKYLSRFDKVKLRLSELLKKMDKDFTYFYKLTLIFAIFGFLVGIVCFKSILLAFFTGLAFSPCSVLYVVFQTQEITRDENSEIQNAMSIITNAYLSSNDVISAFETYTMNRQKFMTGEERKFQRVTPFEEFVTQCTYINPNVDAALEELAAKVSNKYFNEWVKNLRMCIQDSTMKFSLKPVINQMADEKIMQIESDSAMRKTWQNYFVMLILMFSVILVFRIANREWYDILVGTTTGKIIIVGMLIAAVISALLVIRINKPISDS